MSNIELLDAFSMLLAFIFYWSKWTAGRSVFECANRAHVPPTGLMVMANARSDGRNGKTALHLTLRRDGGEYSLCAAICVNSTSLPPFCLMDRNGTFIWR